MQYEKEPIKNELYRLRNKYSFSIDPATGEVVEPKENEELPPEDQAIRKFTKGYIGFDKNYEPTEAEMQLADDVNNLWDLFEENVYECLELYGTTDEIKFFKVFKNLCKALSDLWWSTSYDWKTQSVIMRFLKNINNEYFSEYEQKLWFCMYLNSESDYSKSDIVSHIIKNNINLDYPYPGYYFEEVHNLVNFHKTKADKEAEVIERYNKLVDNFNSLFGMKK
ncbi:MAG: hypothetical protein BWX96_03290 [Bacteroidetes bacterium ADurb.Bin145]|nr:MAG: hypothetical protein BWX96_03290 [Bacteroidetes bacterium ADurb.Bin145]